MLFAMTAVSSLDRQVAGQGHDLDHAGPDDRDHRHRPAERPAALHDGRAGAAGRRRIHRRGRRPVRHRRSVQRHGGASFKGTRPRSIKLKGRLWLTREEWRRSIVPIMRGGLDRLHHRRAAGRRRRPSRRSCRTTVEKKLSKTPGEIRHRRDRRRRGSRGGEQRGHARRDGAAAHARHPGLAARPRSCWARSSCTASSPGRCCSRTARTWSGGSIDSMYIGNIMLLILNLPLIGLFVRLLYIPTGILHAADPRDLRDRRLRDQRQPARAVPGAVFGVIGYIFRKIDIPLAPMVLSLVLGGIMEQSFRQAMTISGADPKIFVRQRDLHHAAGAGGGDAFCRWCCRACAR